MFNFLNGEKEVTTGIYCLILVISTILTIFKENTKQGFCFVYKLSLIVTVMYFLYLIIVLIKGNIYSTMFIILHQCPEIGNLKNIFKVLQIIVYFIKKNNTLLSVSKTKQA